MSAAKMQGIVMLTTGTVWSIRQALCAHHMILHSAVECRVDREPGQEHMSAIAQTRGQAGTLGQALSQRMFSPPLLGTRHSMLHLVSIIGMRDEEPTPKGRLSKCNIVPWQRLD